MKLSIDIENLYCRCISKSLYYTNLFPRTSLIKVALLPEGFENKSFKGYLVITTAH